MRKQNYNEYGEPLDRNDYADSLFDHRENCCDICCKWGQLQRHEIFHGSLRRDYSKRYGCWIYVCIDCHRDIHAHPGKYEGLKQAAQYAAMKRYQWTREDFIRVFQKNYL